MCFHLPFMMKVIENIPAIDILLGKPMPAEALGRFYEWLDTTNLKHPFSSAKQIQWLVDTEERLKDYEAFARSKDLRLTVNLEVDIGLHRGGFKTLENFTRALNRIQTSNHLDIGGMMGYEAHIMRMPRLVGGPKVALNKSKHAYAQFRKALIEVFPNETVCLNTGGSTTYPLYSSEDECNEVSVASALLKPSDFDVSTLEQHLPAAFIATPILKSVDKPSLPGPEILSCLLRKTGLLPSSAHFIYGGNWLASPCYPHGSRRIKSFGHSSNQEMYHIPLLSEGDDFLFFRPHQSEAVLLQFGRIAAYRNGEILDWWSVLDYPETLYANKEKV